MRARLLQQVAAVAALGLGVWAVAVTFTPVGASFTSGDTVSAAGFNAAFDTVDANFVAAEAAIDALEIARPGVAYAATDASTVLTGSTPVDVMTATVDVPAAGYVTATATGYVRLVHTTGGGENMVNFWINDDSATVEFAGWTSVSVPSAAPSGVYRQQVSAQRVFAVTPGSFTAYASSRFEVQGTGSANVHYGSLVLTYVPAAIGPVAGSGVAPAAAPAVGSER